jgi:hypothetical protein
MTSTSIAQHSSLNERERKRVAEQTKKISLKNEFNLIENFVFLFFLFKQAR